jgi:hypothetical protein
LIYRATSYSLNFTTLMSGSPINFPWQYVLRELFGSKMAVESTFYVHKKKLGNTIPNLFSGLSRFNIYFSVT